MEKAPSTLHYERFIKLLSASRVIKLAGLEIKFRPLVMQFRSIFIYFILVLNEVHIGFAFRVEWIILESHALRGKTLNFHLKIHNF